MTADTAFRRYKRVGQALAIAIATVVLAEFYWNFRQPTDRDFISFWGAAQLALAGNPIAVYDMEALRRVMRASHSPESPLNRSSSAPAPRRRTLPR